jgi:hypothetical protein
MVHNQATYGLFLPHLDNPSRAEAEAAFPAMHALNSAGCDPRDISNLVLHLA